ncbi:CocE/NonD family hydrolase [Conexibacter sp. SYSU D00693]|uniref:CocE/NonD family hydrolase n=1 Tax=Conexibacter sp. SYSU D00693 TaxID=2812560 RepID=UPI00196A7AEE|nr:CocE/NonD family hydrolase [Conexibacter sp. SYSU D00693]
MLEQGLGRRLWRAVLAAVCLVLVGGAASAHAASWSDYDRPATNGVVTDREVPITMRDGIVLSATVSRPDRPGRYPVLVTQTPYGKEGVGGFFGAGANYLVQRGYVQVTVDVRGTGASQGQWDSFGTAEQLDGKDVVEWAARQPWSDGNVGLNGPSYMGLNQLYTAALQPAGLKAIFPVVPMADGYRDIVFSGGAINAGFIPLWLGLVTAGSITPPSYALSGKKEDLVRGLSALTSHVTGVANFQLNTLLGAILGTDTVYDGPFWRTRSPLEVVDDIKVPAFVVGGLHDIFQRGEPLVYERLKQRVDARLLIGPWTHVGGSMGEGLPRDGVPSLSRIQLRWFDHWLKGLDSKVGEIPKVTQYAWGAERYEVQDDWPRPQMAPRRMFLRGGKALSADAPRAAESPQGYVQQPLSGICTQSTVQWTAGLLGSIPCAQDNRLDEALGQATYTTPPLEQDLHVDGPIAAKLWITTTAKDAPVTVRLTDVSPSGASTELTSGWLAATFRARDTSRDRVVRGETIQPWHPYTRSSVQAVKPGEATEMDVEVFPTNAVIRKGHRLRVVVAPSDFPHQVPPLPQLRDSLLGSVKVLTDPEHASHVVLPTVGSECAVPAKAAAKKKAAKKKAARRKQASKRRTSSAKQRKAAAKTKTKAKGKPRKGAKTKAKAKKPAKRQAAPAGCAALPMPDLTRG